MENLGGFLFGAIVATFAWVITGCLDLSWITEIFGNLF